MERYCSTGQSPQRAVAPTEEEEEEEESNVHGKPSVSHRLFATLCRLQLCALSGTRHASYLVSTTGRVALCNKRMTTRNKSVSDVDTVT